MQLISTANKMYTCILQYCVNFLFYLSMLVPAVYGYRIEIVLHNSIITLSVNPFSDDHDNCRFYSDQITVIRNEIRV